MSTANFCTINAQRTYAVRTVEYYDPATDEFLDEYRDGCEILNREFLEDDIQGAGALHGWTLEDEPEDDYNRSYPGSTILSKHFSVDGTHSNYTLTAKIILRSGYYFGACLDWDICGDSYDGNLSACRGDMDDFAGILADGELSYLDYYEHWNSGLQKMNQGRIQKRFRAALEQIAAACEKFCAENCDDKLACLGHFSNGEAIYQRID